jgi:hypothetical protein
MEGDLVTLVLPLASHVDSEKVKVIGKRGLVLVVWFCWRWLSESLG